MLYSQIPLGSVLSELVEKINAAHEAMRGMERGTTQPPIAVPGMFWQRTNHPVVGNALLWHNGSAFTFLLDPDFAQVNAGGTVAFIANQPMGGQKFTGLGAGSGAGDSVRFEQVVLITGANAMTGALNMGNQQITNVGAPTQDHHAVRRIDLGVMGKFFQTTGTGAARIDSGWDVGTTNFVQRINQTTFIPGSADLLIRARVLRADTGALIDSEFSCNLRIPRWRHHAHNGGISRHVGGFMQGVQATGGATTIQPLGGTFDNAQSANYDWASAAISGAGGAIPWQLFMRYHVGVTKGVEIWGKTVAGQYVDFDEVGAGNEGVVQLMVWGDAA